MARAEIEVKLSVGERIVTATVLDQVGPEDCYNMLLRAVMHRYVTAEDVVPPIPRDVKDSMIKQSLVI
jgi:hypothetical protein